METIEIKILAQDVNNAGSFIDSNNCILATAIKRQLNVTDVSEGVLHSFINDNMYYHDYGYCKADYKKDIELAKDVPDDTLIRNITLNIDISFI